MLNTKFLVVGDQAVSVEFDHEISLKNNARVRKLYRSLMKKPVEGITDMVPTYASLMIHYRPEILRYEQLKEKLKKRIGKMEDIEAVRKEKQVVVEIPVLYGGELGQDLEYCAELEHITPEELIKIHSQSEYYIYMLGFAPGHPYSARFENPFHFQRRETARVSIPEGSIVVQLNLSDIIPFEQPCGWNVIGNTPVKISDFRRENPFALQAGYWVKYVPITEREYHHIKKQVEKGTYRFKVYEKEKAVG